MQCIDYGMVRHDKKCNIVWGVVYVMWYNKRFGKGYAMCCDKKCSMV